jgi:hypothetical protein
MTIAQQLLDVSSAKTAIKTAIELKGVTVGTSALSTYAAKIGAITSGGGSSYTRPADWLALPTLTETDQKFVGLHMVAEDSNFLALTAAGAFTVDWGDGTVQNFAANVVAEHTYSFSNANLGAVTTNGWKQAIVTLTPQVGQNLTALNLHKKHSQAGLQKYSSGFVDIGISGSLLTSLLIGSSSDGAGTQTIAFSYLEQVNIVKSAVTNLGYLFYLCRSLANIVALDTNSCTNAVSMFQDCSRLQTVPLFNLAACKNAVSMFLGCSRLQTVPLFNLAACTNATFMFQSCVVLQTVPLFNLVACTNVANMFQGCVGLQTVPLFNLVACTNVANMFQGCRSLQTVPLFNLAACTNASGMFEGCVVLQTVPLFNLAACTNATFMFYGCVVLQTVPLFNLAACTNAASMFESCYNLVKGTCSGTKVTISYANNKLSATALNAIYNALGTSAAKTITVTGNWGAATDNPAIATSKGWTVTG